MCQTSHLENVAGMISLYNLVQVNDYRLKVCPHMDIYTVPVKKNGDVFVPFRSVNTVLGPFRLRSVSVPHVCAQERCN